MALPQIERLCRADTCCLLKLLAKVLVYATPSSFCLRHCTVQYGDVSDELSSGTMRRSLQCTTRSCLGTAQQPVRWPGRFAHLGYPPFGAHWRRGWAFSPCRTGLGGHCCADCSSKLGCPWDLHAAPTLPFLAHPLPNLVIPLSPSERVTTGGSSRGRDPTSTHRIKRYRKLLNVRHDQVSRIIVL
jgi:hypothetical protein